MRAADIYISNHKVHSRTCALTSIGEKPRPTKKLADQLTATAMEDAMGRPDWEKSSVTKNQGIDPGPVAKPTTKRITATIAR